MKSYLLIVVLGTAPLCAQSPSPAFTAYPVPFFPFQAGPYGIASGADGALWFQGRFNEIGRITTSGVLTEYPIPNSLWWVTGSITAGPDGAIWFTEFRVNSIGRIGANGMVTEYGIPEPAGAITAGPDGALWFSEGNKIGRITTSGSVTEYPLPNPNDDAGAIAAGPDGALWFIESNALGLVANGNTTINTIGRITTGGSVTEYPLPPATWFQGAFFIVAGPDGAMWFNEYYGGRVGRITMAGVVTEYPLPNAADGTGPASIAAGPDGGLWFPEANEDYFIHTLGRISTSGSITEFNVPVQGFNYSADIALGPDGALWFTDGFTNNIMRFNVRSILAIETTLLNGGHTGEAYSAKLAAFGGTAPYAWSIVNGGLPPGLNLDSTTGVISGKPGSFGSATCTVQVTDSSVPALSATQTLTIGIRARPARGAR